MASGDEQDRSLVPSSGEEFYFEIPIAVQNIIRSGIPKYRDDHGLGNDQFEIMQGVLNQAFIDGVRRQELESIPTKRNEVTGALNLGLEMRNDMINQADHLVFTLNTRNEDTGTRLYEDLTIPIEIFELAREELSNIHVIASPRKIQELTYTYELHRDIIKSIALGVVQEFTGITNDSPEINYLRSRLEDVNLQAKILRGVVLHGMCAHKIAQMESSSGDMPGLDRNYIETFRRVLEGSMPIDIDEELLNYIPDVVTSFEAAESESREDLALNMSTTGLLKHTLQFDPVAVEQILISYIDQIVLKSHTRFSTDRIDTDPRVQQRYRELYAFLQFDPLATIKQFGLSPDEAQAAEEVGAKHLWSNAKQISSGGTTYLIPSTLDITRAIYALSRQGTPGQRELVRKARRAWTKYDSASLDEERVNRLRGEVAHYEEELQTIPKIDPLTIQQHYSVANQIKILKDKMDRDPIIQPGSSIAVMSPEEIDQHYFNIVMTDIQKRINNIRWQRNAAKRKIEKTNTVSGTSPKYISERYIEEELVRLQTLINDYQYPDIRQYFDSIFRKGYGREWDQMTDDERMHEKIQYFKGISGLSRIPKSTHGVDDRTKAILSLIENPDDQASLFILFRKDIEFRKQALDGYKRTTTRYQLAQARHNFSSLSDFPDDIKGTPESRRKMVMLNNIPEVVTDNPLSYEDTLRGDIRLVALMRKHLSKLKDDVYLDLESIIDAVGTRRMPAPEAGEKGPTDKRGNQIIDYYSTIFELLQSKLSGESPSLIDWSLLDPNFTLREFLNAYEKGLSRSYDLVRLTRLNQTQQHHEKMERLENLLEMRKKKNLAIFRNKKEIDRLEREYYEKDAVLLETMQALGLAIPIQEEA